MVVTDYSCDASGNRVKKETVDFSAVATSQSGGTSVGLTISAGPSSTPITFTSNGNLIGSVGSSISAIPPGALVVEYTNSGGNTSVEAVFTSSGEVNFSGTVYQQSTLTSTKIGDFTLLFTNPGQSSANTFIMDMNQAGNVYLAGNVIQELFSSGVAYVDNNYVFTANADTAAFPYAISYALVGGEGREDIEGSSTLFRYYLKDHLGSTRAVWAPDVGTGQLIEATGYLPYGTQVTLIIPPADDATREKFTGKELDKDGEGPDETDPTNTITGVQLDYFGGRYYDAQIGIWVGCDPKKQFFSPYCYVGNNPIIKIDHYGSQAASVEGAEDADEADYGLNLRTFWEEWQENHENSGMTGAVIAAAEGLSNAEDDWTDYLSDKSFIDQAAWIGVHNAPDPNDPATTLSSITNSAQQWQNDNLLTSLILSSGYTPIPDQTGSVPADATSIYIGLTTYQIIR